MSNKVQITFSKPKYNIAIKVAQEISGPVADMVDQPSPEVLDHKNDAMVDDPNATTPSEGEEVSVMDQSNDSSAIKKEEIHKMIDDERKTVEKLVVEESSDGTQKVTIIVKPQPIFRKNPGQNNPDNQPQETVKPDLSQMNRASNNNFLSKMAKLYDIKVAQTNENKDLENLNNISKFLSSMKYFTVNGKDVSHRTDYKEAVINADNSVKELIKIRVGIDNNNSASETINQGK